MLVAFLLKRSHCMYQTHLHKEIVLQALPTTTTKSSSTCLAWVGDHDHEVDDNDNCAWIESNY